jgi:aryl-alcohol dehydrogenase-like predicted oxidoreductase
MSSPLAKLGIGAAQLPLDGQGSRFRGRPPEVEARDILQTAARAGLPVFDVSDIMPSGEAVIGGLLPRPNNFRLCIRAARAERGPEYVEAEARAALARLRVDSVDAMIVPFAADLLGPYGGALWERLQRMRDAGLCRKIGVSVFASDDPLGFARRFHPDLIQAPASLLDQRLLVDGTLAAVAELGIEVHLRSIFLNGLLFLPPDRVPSQLKGAAGRLSRARRLIAEGRSDPLQAALGFALSRPEASAVLVGVTTSSEISAVIAAAASPPPDLDWDEMALDDPVALDPRRWAAA